MLTPHEMELAIGRSYPKYYVSEPNATSSEFMWSVWSSGEFMERELLADSNISRNSAIEAAFQNLPAPADSMKVSESGETALCGVRGGSLDPDARCKFPAGHADNYHSSDGSRVMDDDARGYYWVEDTHRRLEPKPDAEAKTASEEMPQRLALAHSHGMPCPVCTGWHGVAFDDPDCPSQPNPDAAGEANGLYCALHDHYLEPGTSMCPVPSDCDGDDEAEANYLLRKKQFVCPECGTHHKEPRWPYAFAPHSRDQSNLREAPEDISVPCPSCSSTGEVMRGSFVDSSKRIQRTCSLCHGAGRLTKHADDLIAMITDLRESHRKLEEAAKEMAEAIDVHIADGKHVGPRSESLRAALARYRGVSNV